MRTKWLSAFFEIARDVSANAALWSSRLGQAALLSLMMVSLLSAEGVQELKGHLEAQDIATFSLSGLREGQTLYAWAEGTSGNLDPFLALVEPQVPLERIRPLLTPTDRRIPVDVLSAQLATAPLLAWNDDAEGQHAAALKYRIPAAGDYRLLVTSTPVVSTLGDYRLLIGLDTAAVLSGTAVPSGPAIAQPEAIRSAPRRGVQEIHDRLTATRRQLSYDLDPVKAGETLYVLLEAKAGSVAPELELAELGVKPLRIGVLGEDGKRVTLQYTFQADARDLALQLSLADKAESSVEQPYRLLVGLDVPEVLSGDIEPQGRPVIREPIPVRIGVRLHQITNIDQKGENFGVVASMRMQWQDPALAFDPVDCRCRYRLLQLPDFRRYVEEQNTIWPEFSIFNQQGRRWEQNQVVVVGPQGDVLYFELFSATLQAPDFDFRLFPFDTQVFFIRVDSLYPEQSFQFYELPGFSGIGEQLGEEEWIVVDFGTPITHETGSTGLSSSRYSFRFTARRQLTYYEIRVFVPLLIILAVSWVTFFLRDYAKRVDVAAGNLLLFIAFNFTIGADLPRLGYLTLLDVLLVSGFVLTSLVLVASVLLKRAQDLGKQALVRTADRYLILGYPLSYLVAITVVGFLFT